MPTDALTLTQVLNATSGTITIPYPDYTILYISFTNTHADDLHLTTAGNKIFDANNNTFVYSYYNLHATSSISWAGITTGGANDNFLTLSYLPYATATGTEPITTTTNNDLYFIIVLSIISVAISIFSLLRLLAAKL